MTGVYQWLFPWSRHHMEMFSALLSLSVENSVERDRYVELWCFVNSSLNRLLNKQSSCRWFELPWRSCDLTVMSYGGSGNFRKLPLLVVLYRHLTVSVRPLLLEDLIIVFCKKLEYYFNVKVYDYHMNILYFVWIFSNSSFPDARIILSLLLPSWYQSERTDLIHSYIHILNIYKH